MSRLQVVFPHIFHVSDTNSDTNHRLVTLITSNTNHHEKQHEVDNINGLRQKRLKFTRPHSPRTGRFPARLLFSIAKNWQVVI